MSKPLNPELIDAENPEWTDEKVEQSVRIDALPVTLQAKLRRGRLQASVTKERITIRLSPDVVDAFRATGSGWQTRMDAAQMMPSTHRDPIRGRIAAALRAELEVMIVQVAARLARRHRTAPPVPVESGIHMPRQRLPVADHVVE